MNIALVNEMQDNIAKNSNDINDIKSQLTALKLDVCNTVKRDTTMLPGSGCKVVYNKNGLITDTLPLDSADIPALPISKIKGLEDILSNTPNRAELSTISSQLTAVRTAGAPVKCGTKVKIDSKGLVTDVVPLLPDDIPELPISKIQGLQTALSNTRSAYVPESEVFTVKPGTGCRVTWDNKGRVINTDRLHVEDIPSAVLDRINALEHSALNVATVADVNRIDSILVQKIDRVSGKINPGTYTKVVINQDGLVVHGTQLTKADLPQVTLQDIPGLSQALSDTEKSISDINRRLDSIESNRNIVTSANNQEVLNKIQSQIDNIITTQVWNNQPVLPDLTQILAELNNIKDEVTTLSGRIIVLENEILK